jgi:hypothetical protein
LRWAGGGLVATLLGVALIYWIFPPTPPPSPIIDGPSQPFRDIGDIVKLPPEEIFSYAQKFYAEGRLDDGFVLLLTAGDGGHGPAALELGMQYDPVLWGTIATSLTKANAFQARKWYRRASELGVAEADMRLGRLRSWLKEHPESDE